MDTAPFSQVPLAPEGVSLEQFDAYIAETRDIILSYYPDMNLTPATLVAAVQSRARSELQDLSKQAKARAEATEEEIQKHGVMIDDSFENGDKTEVQKQDVVVEHETAGSPHFKRRKLGEDEDPMKAIERKLNGVYVHFCLIDKISQHVELAVELGMHLPAHDVIKLFSISKRFNETIRNNLTSSIRMWLRRNAQESSDIFTFRLYRNLCVPDPAGRTNAFNAAGGLGAGDGQAVLTCPDDEQAVRKVPSLRWFHMVMTREQCVADIVDEIEHCGHTLPPGMERTLKKTWLLMDVATTRGREKMVSNVALWPAFDLYNFQMFYVKLSMYFRDPIWADSRSTTLPELMLGQRSLIKLWQLLTREAFTSLDEISSLSCRYDYMPTQEQFRRAMFGEETYGVPAKEVGTVHLEGWGKGSGHLYRPDEILPWEAKRRGLDLDRNMIYMILWGRSDYPEDEPNRFKGPYSLDDILEESINKFCSDSEDDDGDEPAWSHLSPLEKNQVMLEVGVGEWDWRISRQYLQVLQSRIRDREAAELIASITYEERREYGAPWYEDDDDNAQYNGREDSESENDPDDEIDLDALPDPYDPSNLARRQAVVDDAVSFLQSRFPRGAAPPITPAIQAAIQKARLASCREENLRDYVNRMLFGVVGVPDEQTQFDRGEQAWADHEMEDTCPEWNAYVEEINAPEEGWEFGIERGGLELFDDDEGNGGDTDSDSD